MSKINLLPWREELRKVHNRIFYAILGGSVAVGISLVVLVSMFVGRRIEVQTANIDYIDKELLSVKGEITEIQGLQTNKTQLLERMGVIGSLQMDRFTIVRLLDLLPRIVPDGIYLTEVIRKEDDTSLAMPALQGGTEKVATTVRKQYGISVRGVALTNGSISNFLKNLGEVKWIKGVKLNEVSINKGKESEGLNFQVEFNQIVGA